MLHFRLVRALSTAKYGSDKKGRLLQLLYGHDGNLPEGISFHQWYEAVIEKAEARWVILHL